MTGHDPLTLKAAATLCGVSESTIRRNREKLRKYGATPTPQGWEIPQKALVMAGLLEAPNLSPDSPLQAPLETLQNELAEARLEAREWRARAEERDREREQLIKRAENAEATAQEATATATALALALKQLEPVTRVDEVQAHKPTQRASETACEPVAAQKQVTLGVFRARAQKFFRKAQ